jgi:hypothetical protein
LNLNTRNLRWFCLIALVCLAPLAFSQTVNLTLDNGGPYVMDGIYVGPYNATQNNTQPVQIICDDFAHEVTASESWTATVTQVSNLASNGTAGLTWANTLAGGSALFGANTTFSTLQGYYAMAYLASEMLPLSSNPANATQIGYLAYAIWAVFDASAVKAWLGANSTAWAQVQLLAQNALNGVYSAGQFAGWEILTPNCSGAGSCNLGQPQEFFEYVPEGGTTLMYLLLAGFCCFGTMFLRSRRQRATSVV